MNPPFLPSSTTINPNAQQSNMYSSTYAATGNNFHQPFYQRGVPSQFNSSAFPYGSQNLMMPSVSLPDPSTNPIFHPQNLPRGNGRVNNLGYDRPNGPIQGMTLSSPRGNADVLGKLSPRDEINIRNSNASRAISDTNSEISAADSNTGTGSIKSSCTPCKVCGDKASGYHYGVISCEGCKGFFRRSIQKQIEYKCLREGKCLVIRLNRNRCQYCRFKKCLQAGMSKDSVRYGRMPRRSRSSDPGSTPPPPSMGNGPLPQGMLPSSRTGALAPNSIGPGADLGQKTPLISPNTPGSMSSLDNSLINELISTISQAHMSFCPYTEDRIKMMRRTPITLVPAGSDLWPEHLDRHRLEMHDNLSHLMAPSIQQVVEFAKRIPQFSSLEQPDQLVLIKGAFFEVWLAQASKLINVQERVITLAEGRQVLKQEFDFVYSPALVAMIIEFSIGFNQLMLSDTEIALFCAILLTNPDRPNLSERAKLMSIQECIMSALRVHLSRYHENWQLMLQQISPLMSQLCTIGHTVQQNMQWFREHWSRTKLAPLYAEIYDIPHLDGQSPGMDTPKSSVNTSSSSGPPTITPSNTPISTGVEPVLYSSQSQYATQQPLSTSAPMTQEVIHHQASNASTSYYNNSNSAGYYPTPAGVAPTGPAQSKDYSIQSFTSNSGGAKMNSPIMDYPAPAVSNSMDMARSRNMSSPGAHTGYYNHQGNVSQSHMSASYAPSVISSSNGPASMPTGSQLEQQRVVSDVKYESRQCTVSSTNGPNVSNVSQGNVIESQGSIASSSTSSCHVEQDYHQSHSGEETLTMISASDEAGLMSTIQPVLTGEELRAGPNSMSALSPVTSAASATTAGVNQTATPALADSTTEGESNTKLNSLTETSS